MMRRHCSAETVPANERAFATRWRMMTSQELRDEMLTRYPD
jgi:hypothetical protein